MHSICKDTGFDLLQIDYNEAQKGKNQCDRESAATRNALRAYVNVGNDIVEPEDIYNAIIAGKLKNTKVSVVAIDTTITSLQCQKTAQITQYHSIKFTTNKLTFWRYYEIGKGVTKPLESVHFKSGLSVIKSFAQTDQNIIGKVIKSTKQRKDRQFCSLFFCTEGNCKENFETEEMLESHLLQGKHTEVTAISGMDKAKSIFTAKMHASASQKQFTSSTPVKTSAPSESTIIYKNTFLNPGWALPVCSNFRCNDKQNHF